MNTRRYPRSLDEAFGPYTSHHIEDPAPTRMNREDKAFTWFCALVLAGVCAAAALGWI